MEVQQTEAPSNGQTAPSTPVGNSTAQPDVESTDSVESLAVDGKLGLWEADGEAPAAPAEGASKQPAKVADERLEKTWAMVAERDRKARQAHAALQQKQKDLERYEQVRAAAEKNPWEALGLLGINVDRLLDTAPQKADGDAPKREPQPEVAELRKEVEALKRAREEAQWSEATSRMSNAVYQRITEARDQYPALVEMVADGAVEEVVKAIVIEHGQTGAYPNLDDVLRRAENVYTEELDRVFSRAAKLPRFRDRLGKQPAAQSRPAANGHGQQKTLTNQLGSESPRREERAMTDEEIERETIELLRTQGWVSDEQT